MHRLMMMALTGGVWARPMAEATPPGGDGGVGGGTGGTEANKGNECGKPAEQPKKHVNLMDDPPKDGENKGDEGGKPPEEDAETKAFVDGLKAIDLGEGVTFDDAALTAMRAPLMELCGKDPKKAEGIVKAYTEYRRAEMKAMQEQADAFNDGLVEEAKKRFGKDLHQMVSLAKAGGEKIFGDELWREMRSVPQFTNNPDIIERLAKFGKSNTDDRGAVNKENKPSTDKRDWRERMYGGK